MILGDLTAKQRAAWWAMADYRITICDGAVRSGKSVGADHAWLDFVYHGPAGNLLMVGKTERTLKRNIIDPLVDMFGRNVCRLVQGSGEFFIGDRMIYLAGANDERAQEKIRGVTLVGAYVDEASTVPETFWTMLLSRLSVDGARLIATTNPDGPLHWLKRGFIDRAGELDVARFHFTLDDNPYLPPAYVDAIKAEYTGLWHKRFILGEWVAAEGAVYDMFDADQHVVDELPPIRVFDLAIDYGTTNPFHALLCGADRTGRLYVAREWRYDSASAHRQLTDEEYCARLRAWLEAGADGLCDGVVPFDRVLIDPSAASFRAQLRRDGWANVTPADNAVVDGIRDVASALSADRLFFHRSTKHVQREIVGYSWDSKAQQRGEDAPIKADDHGVDALRYYVRGARRRPFRVRGA